MKLHRALSYLSIAVSALLAGLLHAATVTPPVAGDVFLGVRASGGQGSGTSLIVNVGNDSTFRTATSGSTLSLGNVSADLVATYGADWATRSDLNWGVFGSRNQTNPVVYASRAQSPFGSSASPYAVLNVDNRAATNTQIISVVDAYSQLDASASGPKAALQANKATPASYSFQVGTDGVADFGASSQWTTIEGNFTQGAESTALDFFRLGSNGLGADTVERLGAFSITSGGALSFLAGPVIDQVRVASAVATAPESDASISVIFQRLGDHNANAISATVSLTDGTAHAGVDFTTPANLTVNFAANATTASVIIPIINRTGFQGDRSFTVNLVSATGGYVISPSAASTVVTLNEVDPDPGAIAFTGAEFTASALDTSVQVTLARTSGNGAVSVDVSATGGTLVNGTGYTFTNPTTVSFADGATTASTTVNLSTAAAGTIVLGLSNPTNFSRLGAQTSATINVTGAPGTLAFGAAKYSFNESAGTVNIPVVRTLGLQGQVSVKVTSHAVTAQSPSDFQAVDFTATLNDGVSSVNVPVTLFNTQTGETNETFTLSLTDATGASIGAIATTTVRILEVDSKIPTVVFSTPAANARVLEAAGATITLTGSATDDKGLDRVEYQLNGGTWTSATLVPNATATTGTFNRSITLVPGANTISVRSVDGIGNTSAVITRTITFVNLRALTVNIDPASPANSGTLPAPFPGVDNNREVGKTYTLTAKPAKNFVFDHWSGTGISGPLAELPTLTFVHSAGLVLTAKFVENPFGTGVIGDFNGLVTATGATTPSQSSNGFINVKVTATGSFTGTLKIDGLSLPLSGAFNNSGIARFGVTRTSTLVIPRPAKTSYVLALNLDLDKTVAGTNKITGTLGEQERSTVKPLSEVNADRARYTATDKAPVASQGTYNIIIPAQAQPVGSVLSTGDFPQGDGIGTITVTAAGLATLSGTLADGTPITATAPLSKNATVPLFAQLYNAKGGSFGGEIKLDAGQASSDLAVTSGTDFHWFRPYQAVQYYPFGWLEGVTTGLIGAKYTAPVNASAVPGLVPAADTTVANATLIISDGKLSTPITKDANISAKDVVTKIPPTDPSYTLVITPKTGDVSGTFLHSDGTKPAFKAKIIQKGTNAGAYGFFLTTAPKVINGTGEAGGVSLNHK